MNLFVINPYNVLDILYYVVFHCVNEYMDINWYICNAKWPETCLLEYAKLFSILTLNTQTLLRQQLGCFLYIEYIVAGGR